MRYLDGGKCLMGSPYSVIRWIWSKIGKYAEVFLSHYGVAVAVVSLAGALACVYCWVSQVEKILSFSAQTLRQEREPVAQRFSALESLVLSGFARPQEQDNVSDHARQTFDSIDHEIETLKPLHGTTLSQHLQLIGTEADPTVLQRQFVTLANSSGGEANSPHGLSLFVPAILLPSEPSKIGNANTALRQDQLAGTLDRAPQLEADLSASLRIEQDLERLASEDFGSWGTPLQAYFISRTGVFAGVLRSLRGQTQRSATRIYFAERPYFWETVGQRSGDFYISYPYIDLMGKGVIFTICRAVRAVRVSDAIACVDFAVEHADDVLKDRLRPFQLEVPLALACPTSDGDVGNCKLSESGRDSDILRIVNSNLRRLREAGHLDQMTGGVFRLQGTGLYRMSRWRNWYAKGLISLGLPVPDTAKGAMYFTVPTGKDEDNQKFLAYVIDVYAPQWSLLGYGVGFAFCLLLLGLSLYYTHQARVLSMKFVQDLERVMEISPVAFVHLDEDTHIVGSNPAFRRLSGYSAEELQKRTLSSILSRRSGVRYCKALEFRRQFVVTNPYEIELMCANAEKTRLVVQGAPLHMPPGRVSHILSSRKGVRDSFALPHTFGVLVPSSQVRARYVGLDTGDDLFSTALQVDLQEFAEVEHGVEVMSD
jgi:PAS domain-containing protein